MKRQVRALCVAILVTCASWSAVAGEKEQAKQLFDAGLKLMRMDDCRRRNGRFSNARSRSTRRGTASSTSNFAHPMVGRSVHRREVRAHVRQFVSPVARALPNRERRGPNRG